MVNDVPNQYFFDKRIFRESLQYVDVCDAGQQTKCLHEMYRPDLKHGKFKFIESNVNRIIPVVLLTQKHFFVG